MRRAFCAVALLTLACLLPRAARVGLAGDYVDPIGRITAQDEALYSHSAIAMATQGDWLTPRFMDRLALYKPPMLIWTAAASIRALGISRFTLRLPIVVLSAIVVGVIFLWGAEASTVTGGACAALLLLGNHLFHTLSTLCMTDGLLVAFTTIAMYCLYSDPWLESRAALWGYALASAAAILTKGVAGIFPLAILAVYWVAVRPKERPSLRRALFACGLTLLLASPWFLYQLAAHPRWFWTEHVLVELLGYGAGTPPQTSTENPPLFYLLRISAGDPVLVSAFAISIPAFAGALRRRTAGPVLLACWLAVTLAATLAWQYRNASYLLPLIPPLALIASTFGPFANRQHSRWLLAFLCVAIAIKIASPDSPWALNYREGTIQQAAPALSQYCAEATRNELVVVDFIDDLYASALPLYRLRYAVIGEPPAAGDYGMPFRRMGIVVTAPQFNNLSRFEGRFHEELRQWGIDSGQPIATLIQARSAAELADVVRSNPASDFLVPEGYRAVLADPAHDPVPAGGQYVLLRSRLRGPRIPLAWTCRM